MSFTVKKWLIKVMEAMGNKMYKPGEFGDVRIIENVSYAQDALSEHLLDIVYPSVEQLRYPVIFNIHGGAFCMNSKDKLYHDYAVRLAEDKYAVVNINYTLSIKKVFPAQIFDVITAYDYICKNAANYQFDVDNFFIVGDSAGAYLAALLGCIATNEELQEYYKWKPEVPIRAIAANCGFYDFETLMQRNVHFPLKKSMVQILFGLKKYSMADGFVYSSVLNHLSKTFPPIYIMDTEVRSFDKEALRLAKCLKDKRVSYKLHIYDKSYSLMHVFHTIPKYAEGEEVMKEIFEFFDTYRKQGETSQGESNGSY